MHKMFDEFQTNQNYITVREFFKGEERRYASTFWPEMEDLTRFPEAAVYQTQYGQQLLTGNPYSSALYLKIFAHELYAQWKECVLVHFSHIKKEKWEINNTYQKNAFEIWEQISHYRNDTVFDKIILWTIQTFYAACQMIFIFELAAIIIAPMIAYHYAEQTLLSLPYTLCCIFVCACYIVYNIWWRRERT